jgi:hypothetical protein
VTGEVRGRSGKSSEGSREGEVIREKFYVRKFATEWSAPRSVRAQSGVGEKCVGAEGEGSGEG